MADQQAPVIRESGDIHDTADAFASMLAPQEDTQADSEAQLAEDESNDEYEAAEAEDDQEIEVEDADDEDLDDEADQEDDEDAESPPVYTVKVDGEDVEVTIDELLSGYSRTSDYTRKTQQLAEQRKAIESEAEAARAERAQYAVLLEQMQQQLQGEMNEPNWEELYQQDPQQFVLQREMWRTKQEKMQAVQSEQMRLAQQQQAEQQQQLQTIISNEKESLAAAIPEWSDAEVATREKAEIKRYAQEKLGMSEAESNAIYDHRVVLALRKAYMYDQLTSKPVKAKKPMQKPVKPGSRASAPKPQTALTKAKQRLAKSGHTQDAASAFELLL